jgi:hypothetical protein
LLLPRLLLLLLLLLPVLVCAGMLLLWSQRHCLQQPTQQISYMM